MVVSAKCNGLSSRDHCVETMVVVDDVVVDDDVVVVVVAVAVEVRVGSTKTTINTGHHYPSNMLINASLIDDQSALTVASASAAT